jgi:hypothetical protein
MLERKSKKNEKTIGEVRKSPVGRLRFAAAFLQKPPLP